MATIGSLVATLGLNTARFEAGIKKSETSLSRFKRQARRHFNDVRKSANQLGGAMTKMAGSIAAVVGPGALILLTKQSYAAADAQAKLADTLGVSVSALAGFELAGQRTGASAEQVKKSFERLAVNVSDAAKGIGTAAPAFKTLGINASELVQLSLDEQFKRVSEAIKNVKNPTERLGIAFDIFGRQGTNMIKMLQLGRDELEKYEQRVKDLGVALERWEVTNIEDANDAVLEAKMAMEGFGNIIALKTAPIVQGLAEEFTNAAIESKGFRSEVDMAIDGFVAFIGGIADVINGIKLAYTGALLIIQTAIVEIAKRVDAARAGITWLADVVKKAFNDAWSNIKIALSGMAISIRATLAESLMDISDFANKANELTGGKIDLSFGAGAKAKEFADSLNKMNVAAAAEIEKLKQQVAEPIEFSKVGFSDFTGWMIEEAKETKQELDEILGAPPPSERFKAWVEERRRLAAEAAAVAKQQTDDQAKTEAKAMTWTEKLRKEGADRLAEYQMLSEGEKSKFVIENANKEFSGLKTNNKKIMAMQKSVKIAEALMNTYASATTNLNAYPQPMGAIMAALSVASGLSQVAQIRAQSFEGGGYTGGGSRSGGLDGKGGYMAMVHPREQITDLTKQQPMAQPMVQPQNIRIVNAFDVSVVGDFMGSVAGEKAIMNVVKRNQNTLRALVV